MLVTIWDNNQGNMLQRYAMMTVLNKMNCDVTHVYRPNKGNVITVNHMIKARIKYWLGWMGVSKYKTDYEFFIGKRNRVNREKVFKDFYNQFFPKRIQTNSEYNNVDVAQFDCAICGSDQVWHNWHNFEHELYFYYLQFVKDKNKRIAYAPSFGFSSFNDEDIDAHKAGIDGIGRLSVREEKGAQLIEQLTGKTATVVLDPTLLLSDSEWNKIVKVPNKKVPPRFLFLYFLGNRTKSVSEMYLSIAREKNLEIVDLSNRKWFECIGPSEFLCLIKNAEYVCTDSFHATVFSIIYHKDFRVIKRSGYGFEDMFDRLDNLLNIVDLKNRIFEEDGSILIDDIVWEKVDDRILSKRRQSYSFLKQAIECPVSTTCSI